jgi:protein-S-isoprenylcysteine O-methyltransferase Ste14
MRPTVIPQTSHTVRPDPSIERTSSGKRRLPPAAAHVTLGGRRRRVTSNPRANPDPARPVPEAANLGVARPPLVYLGSMALGVIVHFAQPVSLLPRGVSPLFGAAVVLLAIGLFLFAVRTFRAAGTPVPGNRPTTTIVRTGPYRFSRNPIYLAFSLLQLGIALWVNSLWLVLTLLAAVAVMSLVVIPREERRHASLPSTTRTRLPCVAGSRCVLLTRRCSRRRRLVRMKRHSRFARRSLWTAAQLNARVVRPYLGSFMQVNCLAVLVAALSSFLLGGLWCSPLLFGSVWQRAIVYAHLVRPPASPVAAVVQGLLLGAGLVAACFGINYQFANRSTVMWLIDGADHTVQIAIYGLILGVWR